MSEGREIALTIIQQLGGFGKLKAMVNARDFVHEKNDVRFKFSGCRKCNIVSITLNGSDLYDVVFLTQRVKDFIPQLKIAGEFKDVYAEDLKRTFEEFTGLYLSLGTMR